MDQFCAFIMTLGLKTFGADNNRDIISQRFIAPMQFLAVLLRDSKRVLGTGYLKFLNGST